MGTPECMQGIYTHCTNGVPTKDSTYHPERERSYGGGGGGGRGGTAHGNGSGGVSSGGGGTSSGGGGCDRNCVKALNSLVQNEKSGIHKELAIQLRKYILATAGNTRPCSAGNSVNSGEAAACNYLSGQSSQLSWQDLLTLWADGKGEVNNVVFDDGSPLNRELMLDKPHQAIMAKLAKKVIGADFDAPVSELGDNEDHADAKSNFFGDNLGMLTDGAHGNETPTAFMGSYNIEYQVIAQSNESRSFVVAFASYNKTGVGSLTHVTGDMPPGHAFASIAQEYYGTVTVSVR
ncbi:hypothetical protein [Streptomyces bauhiniae]|uniref:Uncharacterized protein n=1 Tax=Streptomyces bauhiniae TaxID=2340725 RepID=A0A7K3QS31_9ACTN|nr:hypothetical protein [Streptomyces bauhiniae]NEB92714.1 hypothetical protein [Streptomyces bauhiniae]